jgi:L-iditol 2-dehydrogenase
MRVAMYYRNNDIRIQDMPVPTVGIGEILMRVESSGICGSDVMEWYRLNKVPLVLGHEIAGEIVDIGNDVAGYKKGDRIAAFHHVPCNTCHYCRNGHPTVCDTLRKTNFTPGGFAEFVKLSPLHVDRGILKVPPSVTYDEATFIEPLACVLRGQHIAGMSPGKTVLVLGSGISGLLHVHVARVLGAQAVVATDINPFRLAAAEDFGATKAVHASENIAEQVRAVSKGRLADIVIVCASSKTVFEQSLSLVERGGIILFFAAAEQGAVLPIPVNELFWRNEVTLTSSYAAGLEDVAEALEWIHQKKARVGDMITHRLPLEDITQGFQLVAAGKESIKVIIKPTAGTEALRHIGTDPA